MSTSKNIKSQSVNTFPVPVHVQVDDDPTTWVETDATFIPLPVVTGTHWVTGDGTRSRIVHVYTVIETEDGVQHKKQMRPMYGGWWRKTLPPKPVAPVVTLPTSNKTGA